MKEIILAEQIIKIETHILIVMTIGTVLMACIATTLFLLWLGIDQEMRRQYAK